MLVQACLLAPPVVADEAKLAIVFTYFCFSPTSGKLPSVKICFPQYFGITRRYMQKKYLLGVNFIFLRKKGYFSDFFLLFTASVRSRPPGPPAVPGVLKYVQVVIFKGLGVGPGPTTERWP